MICRDFGQDGSPTCHFSISKSKGFYHYVFAKDGLLAPDPRMKDTEGDAFKGAVAMARDGRTLCYAQKRMYRVVNLMTQVVTELFPYVVAVALSLEGLFWLEV
jgi:hypothetical protein